MLKKTTSPNSDQKINILFDGQNVRPNAKKSLGSRAKDFARFTLYRQSAWIEWIGGIAGGNMLVEAGIPRSLATTAVIATVYGAESYQAGIERRALPPTEVSQEMSAKKKLLKDIVGLGFSMWQGAASTATYNRANGLENTRKRNNIQSLAYASAVGYWVSPLPFAEEGRDWAQEQATSAMDYALENPAGAGLGALVVSAVVYGSLSALDKFRSKGSTEIPEQQSKL